jgi:centromeric protein E
MPEEAIQVGVRVRPLNAKELAEGDAQACWIKSESSANSLLEIHETTGELLAPKNFDYVFGPDSTNQEVYEAMVTGALEGCMKGYNACIMAYGQTSSGKTHTLMGNAEEPGFIPAAIHDIFGHIAASKGTEYLLHVSYLEIYNEAIKDLLSETDGSKKKSPSGKNSPEGRTGKRSPRNQRKKEFGKSKKEEIPSLRIIEDKVKGAVVAGAVSTPVREPDQVLLLVEAGERRRHYGATGMNANSSRSHTVFKMMIEGQPMLDCGDVDEDAGGAGAASVSTGSQTYSTLTLVDLAGSERLSKTKITGGMRKAESGMINKSLLVLGLVISTLSKGKGGHVPFRDSKLTYLLQSSLGGNSRTAMVCTLSPDRSNLGETHSTLLFAERAKLVKNKAKQNSLADEASEILRYRKEITQLRQQLRQAREHALLVPHTPGPEPAAEKTVDAAVADVDAVVAAKVAAAQVAAQEADAARLRQMEELILVSSQLQQHRLSADESEQMGKDMRDMLSGRRRLQSIYVSATSLLAAKEADEEGEEEGAMTRKRAVSTVMEECEDEEETEENEQGGGGRGSPPQVGDSSKYSNASKRGRRLSMAGVGIMSRIGQMNQQSTAETEEDGGKAQESKQQERQKTKRQEKQREQPPPLLRPPPLSPQQSEEDSASVHEKMSEMQEQMAAMQQMLILMHKQQDPPPPPPPPRGPDQNQHPEMRAGIRIVDEFDDWQAFDLDEPHEQMQQQIEGAARPPPVSVSATNRNPQLAAAKRMCDDDLNAILETTISPIISPSGGHEWATSSGWDHDNEGAANQRSEHAKTARSMDGQDKLAVERLVKEALSAKEVDHTEMLSAKEVEHSVALAEMIAKHAEALQCTEAKHAEAVVAKVKEHSEAMLAKEAEHAAVTEATAAELLAAMGAKEAEHKEIMEATATELLAAMEAKEVEHEEHSEEKEQQHSKAMEAKEAEHRKVVEEKEAAHSVEMTLAMEAMETVETSTQHMLQAKEEMHATVMAEEIVRVQEEAESSAAKAMTKTVEKLKQELRRELEGGIRAEVEQTMRLDLRASGVAASSDSAAPVEKEAAEEVGAVDPFEKELREQLAETEREELREQLVESVREELREHLKEELEQDVRQDLREQLEQTVREELEDTLREDVREQLEQTVREELEDTLREDVREDVKEQMTLLVSEELQDPTSPLASSRKLVDETLHQPSEVKAAAVVALEELEGELREKEEELRQKALVLERREMEVRVEDGVLERGRREQQQQQGELQQLEELVRQREEDYHRREGELEQREEELREEEERLQLRGELTEELREEQLLQLREEVKVELREEISAELRAEGNNEQSPAMSTKGYRAQKDALSAQVAAALAGDDQDTLAFAEESNNKAVEQEADSRAMRPAEVAEASAAEARAEARAEKAEARAVGECARADEERDRANEAEAKLADADARVEKLHQQLQEEMEAKATAEASLAASGSTSPSMTVEQSIMEQAVAETMAEQQQRHAAEVEGMEELRATKEAEVRVLMQQCAALEDAFGAAKAEVEALRMSAEASEAERTSEIAQAREKPKPWRWASCSPGK